MAPGPVSGLVPCHYLWACSSAAPWGLAPAPWQLSGGLPDPASPEGHRRPASEGHAARGGQPRQRRHLQDPACPSLCYLDSTLRVRLKQPNRSPDRESEPHCKTTALGWNISITLDMTCKDTTCSPPASRKAFGVQAEKCGCSTFLCSLFTTPNLFTLPQAAE